jgi:RNA polymerase sigma-70 factor (ECF subfamily)
MTDRQLLTQAANGDEAAFQALYERHRDPVYRLAWALTRSEADAEEIVQDGFLTIVRKAREFRPEAASLRTWLLGVTRNLCYRRRGKVAADEIGEPEEVSIDAGIEAALIRNQTAEAVRRAVTSLPEAQREAIVLFDLEELSLAETAAALGIDPNAVKARLHRGRARLKSILPPLAAQRRPGSHE